MQDEERLLGELRRRVDTFIQKHRDSPLYDFNTPCQEGEKRLRELRDAMSLHVRGELELDKIELAARLYCLAYKRPEGGAKPAPRRSLSMAEIRRGFRDIEGENREACRLLYFTGETPIEGGTCVETRAVENRDLTGEL
jgi:hypothetical protein